MLIDDPWNGGHGHGLNEVCDWTLDQVLMALVDRKLLSNNRKQTMNPLTVRTDEDGLIAGRAADGSAIQGRIRGKSKARELMEIEEARRKENGKKKRRRRRGS